MNTQAKGQEKPLPFWTTSDSITYTELTRQRQRQYKAMAPEALAAIEKNLRLYRQTQRLCFLQEVNHWAGVLLEIEPRWLDFSVQVLEAIMCSGRPVMAANDLLKRFQDIQKEIEHGAIF